MNYELAKQLKDASFPNSEKWDIVILPTRTTMGYRVEKGDGIEVPNLNALIEACGDGLISLSRHKNPDGWFAYSKVEDEHGNNLETLQPTPEEAVAELWLELNKILYRQEFAEYLFDYLDDKITKDEFKEKIQQKIAYAHTPYVINKSLQQER